MTGWRKSTRCNHGECLEVCDGGSCVEVASLPVVAVRDSKDNGSGPVLTFTHSQWKVFTRAVKG